jgi:hypothetical protein
MPCPRAPCRRNAVVRPHLKDAIISGSIKFDSVTPCEGDALYMEVMNNDRVFLNLMIAERVPWTKTEVSDLLVRAALREQIDRVGFASAVASMGDADLFFTAVNMLDDTESMQAVRRTLTDPKMMNIAREALKMLQMAEEADANDA